MKKCSNCKQEKELGEYNKDKYQKDGLQGRCKSCCSEYDKKYHREILKDGYHHVYYLPAHNYVGTSDLLEKRMITHRKNGKDTTGYEVWKSFENREDALYFEALLHEGGYEGKHPKNLYK